MISASILHPILTNNIINKWRRKKKKRGSIIYQVYFRDSSSGSSNCLHKNWFVVFRKKNQIDFVWFKERITFKRKKHFLFCSSYIYCIVVFNILLTFSDDEFCWNLRVWRELEIINFLVCFYFDILKINRK